MGMGYSAAAILAIICIGAADATNTGTTVQGWLLPADWKQGKDYVVVQTSSKSVSQYGGYIFPGPEHASASSISYSSPDGYMCEAKHYDHNYGIFETQACANRWTKLITMGDSADEDMSGCKTVASRPCGCQGICRPVSCSMERIFATNKGDAANSPTDYSNLCDYYTQCRRQEELGLVTSCAETAVFQVSMWFGIIFSVVVAFVAFAMMNMPLDMDSLLYTVGDPEKKDN